MDSKDIFYDFVNAIVEVINEKIKLWPVCADQKIVFDMIERYKNKHK